MKDNYFDTLKVRIYQAANNANSQADTKDINRNHVNYGAVAELARIMRDFGHKTDIPVWEDDNGCLRIPYIEIDGSKYIEFDNGK